MDTVARFFEYAMAFEQALALDDWSLIEPYFTEDAVYEIFGGPPFAGRHEGRSGVIAFLRESVRGFDRRFTERKIEMRGEPTIHDGAVHVPWRGVYRAPGVPDMILDGEELAWFSGDRICRLEDRYDPAELRKAMEYFEHHESRLLPPG